jgi:poly-gamma-glutamate synthesis protein (capsule biosynthesis protein)
MKYWSISSFLILILLSQVINTHATGQEDANEVDLEIVILGDMVFDGSLGDRIRSQGIEYPFELIRPHIKGADITLANLESPISERGKAEQGKYCTFRSRIETVECLVDIGIDAVSLSNNHCLDYGHDALNDTMEVLEENGIHHAGIWYDETIEDARIPRPVIMHRNGLKVGFLAYTEDVRDHWRANANKSGPMPIDPELMEYDIKFAKKLVDILIVSIHWRKWPQYTTGPEETDRILCKNTIDWGADIIMGHGPHTVHEIEEYGDGVIFYSIGNSAMINGHENASFSYIPKMILRDGELFSFELIPIVLGTVRYVPEGTPITRTEVSGFNVSNEEIWMMYDNDIYDLMDEEKGIREWRILLEDSPWYLKILLILLLSLILILILIILFTMIRRAREHNNQQI